MKASELIYRLARAIEANGDCEVRVAVEADTNPKLTVEANVKCLDIHVGKLGAKYFEIYGEEQ